MFEFELPIGAIVEILDKRYRHLGNGKFTGLAGDERPYIIEGVVEVDDGTASEIIVSRVSENDCTKPRHRVVWRAFTQEENATKGAAMLKPITIGDSDMHCSPKCPHLLPDHDRLCCGTCKLDERALGYHDWYLAHCKGQLSDESPKTQRAEG